MPEILPEWSDPNRTPFDFILVGAGAGGAPLAARLAERGYTVLVTEMGPEKPQPVPGAVVENTEVPLLHGEATEDARHSLRFFVNHFDSDPAGSIDPKIHKPEPGTQTPHPEDENGIFYPRAQGVGGCTIHNAMITVSGPSEDWDQIAEPTGDESWRGERMRAYFERIEHCHYNQPTWKGRLLNAIGLPNEWAGSRHGNRGWLDTTVADLGILFRDKQLLRVVIGAAVGSLESGVEQVGDLLWTAFSDKTFAHLDPNNWQNMRQGGEGLARIPCAITPDGRRSDPRARLIGVKADREHGKRLTILSGVFVTAIEFDRSESAATIGGVETTCKAIGIRCLQREHVYEADPAARAVGDEWKSKQVKLFCKLEVILCGGAFNTPQLLMLSGLGPKDHLAAYGIDCIQHLPGIGLNLQDRYEVPVVARVTDSFKSLSGLGTTSHGDIASRDLQLQKWRANEGKSSAQRGLYATNGGLIGIFKRSSQEDAIPDLFIFALAGHFAGYAVGYSRPAAFAGLTAEDAGLTREQFEKLTLDEKDELAAASPKKTITWLLLKARTRQHGGEVRLRTASPFRRPEINFRSFPQGEEDPDVRALVDGVRFVTDFLEFGKAVGTVAHYECPGLSDLPFDKNLNKWIRHVAWGHHACGTCRIGGDIDDFAVLDSRFRVRGVKGLRVVDACVFPRIPGFFIVTNVYMVAEKAADVLTEDHPRPIESLPVACREALARDPVLRSSSEYEARRLYPVEMEAREAELIRSRRKVADLPPDAPTTP